MPTVIDSLVVELGLDPTNFNLQQREAFETAKRLEAQQLKAAKNIEHGAGKASSALAATRTQAAGLIAMLTGGGIIAFGSQINAADAAVGRLSRNIGVNVATITKWQGAARIFGGDAQSMAQSFTAMSDAFAGMQIGQMTPMIAELRALGAAGGHVIETFDSIETKWSKVAKNLQAINARDPATAGLMGRRLGIDPALYDALISGNLEKVLKLTEALGGATKDAADQASRLEQTWNRLKLAVEGVGRAISNKLNLPGWIESFAEIFEGFANGKVLKGSWADKIAKIYNPSYKGGYEPVGDKLGLTGKSAAAPAVGGGYRNAIGNIESRGSGGYGAVGPVTSSGDRAYGRYQIMGRNIGPWSEEALGRRVSIEEFMKSPEIQDKIFDHRFNSYVQKYGNASDAASAWHSGRPLAQAQGARDSLGTSTPEYVRRFNAEMAANGNAGNTSTTEVNIQNVTVVAPNGVNANQWASEFEKAVKARAFQANAGQS